VLIWNLYHGRSRPPASRDLEREFTELIAGWPWDLALLQEVPPWWPRPLAEASRASMRMALTSRNTLLPLRRALAVAKPDLMKSWGGGCNAILVRGARILRHERATLRHLPERRVVHAVRLDTGLLAANLHAQTQPRSRPDADAARARAFLGGARFALVGGDFNVADPVMPGWTHAGGRGVDHLYVRGLEPAGVERLDTGRLSDHPALLVSLR